MHRLGLDPALLGLLNPALLRLLAPSLLLLSEHVALLTRPASTDLLRLHRPRLGLGHGYRRLGRLRRWVLLGNRGPNRSQPNRTRKG